MGSGYLGGGPYLPFATTAVSVTLTDEHYTMQVTAGGITVTLPPSNRVGIGRIFIVKSKGLSETSATVAPSGSDTIDTGASTTVTAYASLVLQSDGNGNWDIIASH